MYYGGYGMYNGFYNTSYILVIIGAVICLLASFRVKSTYKKYAKVLSASGMTGAQAAQMILDRNGVVGVSVQHVAGELTTRPTTHIRWRPSVWLPMSAGM